MSNGVHQSSRRQIDKDGLKLDMRGHCRVFLRDKYGFDPPTDSGREHSCPKCGGNTRFRPFDDFDETGGCFCSHCFKEKNGDFLSTAMWLSGEPFAVVLRNAADWLDSRGLLHRGVASPPGRSAKPAPITEDSDLGTSATSLKPERNSSPGQDGSKPKRKFEKTLDAVAFLSRKMFGEPRKHDQFWKYSDRDGNLLGIVLRWNTSEPPLKQIRQIRKTPDNKWQLGGMDAPRPLYRLPELITSDEVWIFEGEKAADSAVSVGLNATTPSQGAQSPQLTDFSVLNGKSVIICPDNDDPGRAFAATLLNLIRSQAPSARVKIVDLRDIWDAIPEKGDLYDYQEHFDTLDKETIVQNLQSLQDRTYRIDQGDGAPVTNDQHQIRIETFSAWDLVDADIRLDEEIIEGVLRRGEVGNLIAATKMGKSWLSIGLACCTSVGRRWLGRQTHKGNVLLIDNELRKSTLQHRIKTVLQAMDIRRDENHARLEVTSLRGQFADIQSLEHALTRFQRDEFALIILDAKYRAFGPLDENSNTDQTLFHNAVDKIAGDLNSAFLMVHHSTKGDQGGKSTVDVGSGGGSQARAVDTHLIIRPHSDDGFAVLDAAVRSFAPVESQTLQWEFPLWHLAGSVEPILRAEKTRNDSRQDSKDLKALGELTDILHAAGGAPMTRYELHKQFGGGFDRLNRLVRLGLNTGRIVQTGNRPGKKGPVDEFTVTSRFNEERNDTPDLYS